MPGYILHSGAQVSCFHQAPAPIVKLQPKVLVNAAPVATAGALTPAGCPFTTGGNPQPCTTITWTNVSTRVTVYGQPLLLHAPPVIPGTCLAGAIPQGLPMAKLFQTRVIAT